jgi:hypothetical protein
MIANGFNKLNEAFLKVNVVKYMYYYHKYLPFYGGLNGTNIFNDTCVFEVKYFGMTVGI